MSIIIGLDCALNLQRCPNGVSWQIRAASVCLNNQIQYHCLLDITKTADEESFVEECIDAKSYKSGLRIVYGGNLHAVYCRASFYSPISVSSNEGENCRFQKSVCNEEGQIIANNGSADTDRSCRCDYKKGYIYTTKPNDPYLCSSSTEDCSCYMEHCSGNDQFINQDYKCQNRNGMKIHHPEIDSDSLNRDKEVILKAVNCTDCGFRSTFDYDAQSRKYTSIALNILISVTCVLLMIAGFFVLLVEFPEWGTSNGNYSGTIFTPNGRDEMSNLEHQVIKPEGTSNGNYSRTIVTPNGRDEMSNLEHQVIKPEGTSNGNYSGTIVTPNKRDEMSNLEHQVIKPEGKTALREECNTPRRTFNAQEKDIYQESFSIPVVAYFQPVKQLEKMKIAFRKRGIRLLILQGQRGSGKTQAAHEFFHREKRNYSVTAKLSASDDDKLFESLKTLARNLKLDIENIETQGNLTINELLREMITFFTESNNLKCSYLLFIDDANSKHQAFLHVVSILLRNVKRLKVIIATFDATVKSYFTDGQLIAFKGMTINECKSLLEKGLFSISIDDVTKIVECTGTLPLNVSNARQYLITSKKSPKRYVADIKKMKPGEKYDALNHNDIFYPQGLLNAHRLPLLDIKQNIEAKDRSLWEFLMFLPFFQFDSISTTVLEACYFQFTDCSCTDKTSKIDLIVEEFLKYSICHIHKAARPAIRPGRNMSGTCISKEDRFLSFHEVTFDHLQWIISQNENDNDKHEERKKCLLKWFCFEIDIDARADTTLERNKLFIDHAKKLFGMFQENSITVSTDMIYLAYLSCAIGSTLYFQNTDLEISHKYLMKSRNICFQIVKRESVFTKSVCPMLTKVQKPAYEKEFNQISVLRFDKEEIDRISRLLFESPCSKNFIVEFNLHKRRSKNDLSIIKMNHNANVLKSYYLSETEYETLIKEGRAVPVEDQCKIFLHELLQRILYNNGRTLKELYYLKNKDSNLQEACYEEFKTVTEFCSLMKEKFTCYQLFSFIENDRSGRMLLRSCQTNFSVSEINDDIEFYEKMTTEPFKICFEFGVVKMLPSACDLHICLQILLKNLQRKFMEVSNEGIKAYIYENGKKVIDGLEKILEELEKNESYVWLNLPRCYIQCAQFLQLTLYEPDLEKAVKLFQRAADLEESRGVHWTRYLWFSYYGEVFCLRKLRFQDEAMKIIEKVKKKLDGTNRNHLIRTLEELPNQFP